MVFEGIPLKSGAVPAAVSSQKVFDTLSPLSGSCRTGRHSKTGRARRPASIRFLIRLSGAEVWFVSNKELVFLILNLLPAYPFLPDMENISTEH